MHGSLFWVCVTHVMTQMGVRDTYMSPRKTTLNSLTCIGGLISPKYINLGLPTKVTYQKHQ